MRIALAQINSTLTVEDNLAKVAHFAAEAARAGAALVQFPEGTMRAFGPGMRQAVADAAPGWQSAVAGLAQEHGITVVTGEFECREGRITNHLAVYSPGQPRRSYAKIHLYDAFGFRESDTVEPGDELVTVDIAGTTVGLAICYDIRFPKLFAELSRRGAQVTLVSASWGAGPGKLYQWDLLARARALDSNMFICAVDQADPQVSGVDVPDGPTGVGGSLVADPFGAVVGDRAGGEETLLIAELDLDIVARAKEALPVLENARLGY